MTTTDREFDVIVWGATGFTGRLTAEFLLERYGIGENLRWALGGRNERKLEDVRSGLERDTGVPTTGLPIVLADANDEASIRALTARTRVVCTTVGPYALHGSPVVAACAEGGTHYCDLTGEAHWMRRMIDAHDEAARSSGARIVFTCGFDCIPADVGTFFLQREMQARHGVSAREVKGLPGKPARRAISTSGSWVAIPPMRRRTSGHASGGIAIRDTARRPGCSGKAPSAPHSMTCPADRAC